MAKNMTNNKTTDWKKKLADIRHGPTLQGYLYSELNGIFYLKAVGFKITDA